MSSTFHIRQATVAAGDSERFLAFFDSQLQWLETVGSQDQWGSTPRGGNEAAEEQYRDKVRCSEASAGRSFSAEWTRAYILEAEVDGDLLNAELRSLSDRPGQNGRVIIPLAAMVLESKSADYVRSILPEQDHDDPFVYLQYLITDRRTSSINKGAGAVLLKHAQDEVRNLGIRRITGDCWSGNDRKLVRFYENQGFRAIGDFKVVSGEDSWSGAVFEMKL